tara:strand:+ start:4257 stop:4451 length:195 start_codon:yes stop_codon:yes gene_type:complete
MKQPEIVKTLNDKYVGKYIFEVTDSESDIVGFVDDNTFQNIIAVIEPTEKEMTKLIKHIENHSI